jgi:hypothetical protein
MLQDPSAKRTGCGCLRTSRNNGQGLLRRQEIIVLLKVHVLLRRWALASMLLHSLLLSSWLSSDGTSDVQFTLLPLLPPCGLPTSE